MDKYYLMMDCKNDEKNKEKDLRQINETSEKSKKLSDRIQSQYLS